MEFIVFLLCMTLLIIVGLKSEKKVQDLSLVFAFLFLINAVYLLPNVIGSTQGEGSFDYLYIFSISAPDGLHFFNISLILSLISFTVFIIYRTKRKP